MVFKKRIFKKNHNLTSFLKKFLMQKKKGFNSPISIWFNNSLNEIAKEVTLDSAITNLIKKVLLKNYGKNMKRKKLIIASDYLA